MLLIYTFVVTLIAIILCVQKYYSQEQTASEFIPVPIRDHKTSNYINGNYLK